MTSCVLPDRDPEYERRVKGSGSAPLSEQRRSQATLPDYEQYTLQGAELVRSLLVILTVLSGISLLCYGNIAFAVLLLPYVFFYLHKRRRKLLEERKWQLNLEFAEALRCISAALEAGYSVENAIAEAYSDLKLSFSEQSMIMCELRAVIAMLHNNVPVEEAFAGFAERSGLEDVKGFVDIFTTAKRTGGNIIAIIRSTNEMTRTRLELKRELKTVIAAPKYESDIMRLVPFGVLLYLRIFSPDMVAALYGSLKGAAFMTVILIIYAALGELADRIVKIEL